MYKSSEILELGNALLTTRREEGFKDFLDGLSGNMKSFGVGLENFSLTLANLFKSNENMIKQANEYRKHLNNIDNRVLSKFDTFNKDGSKLGPKAYNLVKEEKIPYITSTTVKARDINIALASSADILKETNRDVNKGVEKVSKYIETLMNSEEARTAKNNPNLETTVLQFKNHSKELDAILRNAINRKDVDTLTVEDVFEGPKDYEMMVKDAINLCKNLDFTVVNTLKKEIKLVSERVDLFASYVEDKTFVLSDHIAGFLVDTVDTFSKFTVNIALLATVYLEYMECLVVTGRMIESKMK